MSGWDKLTEDEQVAASVAGKLLEDAKMRFVIMLFGASGQGAVISNIAPGDAAGMIGQAYLAAKASVDFAPIDGKEHLQ